MKIFPSLILVLFLSACGGEAPAPQQTTVKETKAPDEKAALEIMAKTNEAQSIHFKKNRRYALTFEELVETRLLNAEPSSQAGYEFKLRPAADAQTYSLVATPTSAVTTARYFFSDQSGEIHSEQGKEATASSPAVPK